MRIRRLALLTFFFSISIPKIQSFDYSLYMRFNPDLQGQVHGFIEGMHHYINVGRFQGRKCVREDIKNTNFDWEYYCKTNHLPHIKREKEAQSHYQTIGSQKNLPYCKSYKIVILFHLYNVDLVDEFIRKINNFIRLNNVNSYAIKISVPVDVNINSFTKNYTYNSSNLETIRNRAPYHRHLVTEANAPKLNSFCEYLYQNIQIARENIQIMFLENRGQDIGSFFLMMDQMFKQNMQCDFIVKIHTKSYGAWREILTSFLNVKINRLLAQYGCIFSSKLSYNFRGPEMGNMRHLLNIFGLPEKRFAFCGGTMFIASSQFLNFFRDKDLLGLFNRLNLRKSGYSGELEYAFERFFGYLFMHYRLKRFVLGYYPEGHRLDFQV